MNIFIITIIRSLFFIDYFHIYFLFYFFESSDNNISLWGLGISTVLLNVFFLFSPLSLNSNVLFFSKGLFNFDFIFIFFLSFNSFSGVLYLFNFAVLSFLSFESFLSFLFSISSIKLFFSLIFFLPFIFELFAVSKLIDFFKIFNSFFSFIFFFYL